MRSCNMVLMGIDMYVTLSFLKSSRSENLESFITQRQAWVNDCCYGYRLNNIVRPFTLAQSL
jgi:hypothetical protein